MAERFELRDPDAARQFLLQSLLLARIPAVTPETFRATLDASLTIVSGGQALTPLGFLADLGSVLTAPMRRRPVRDTLTFPGPINSLMRTYDDYVLGKLDLDWTIERASDAIRGYSGKERTQALAFVHRQIAERCPWGGVDLPPAAIRQLLTSDPERTIEEGRTSLSTSGLNPQVVTCYEQLIGAFRLASDLLSPEDLAALDQRMALVEMGPYVAHRQILTTCALFEKNLPPPSSLVPSIHREIPTHLADEDIYPVGGYASIATKGSPESLLHSQLAFMEPDARPDLFDVKFVRDELFYYSRDENQFLRRHRRFAVVFNRSMVEARVKDRELPVQRIVLAISLVITLIRTLDARLSSDALHFSIIFPNATAGEPLAEERRLVTILLKDLMDRGVVEILSVNNREELVRSQVGRSRGPGIDLLHLSTNAEFGSAEGFSVTEFRIDGPKPRLAGEPGTVPDGPDDEPFEVWSRALNQVLLHWL